MNQSERELYKIAIETFGIDSQLEMVVEECAEVIQAIQHFKRDRTGVEPMVGEMVDAFICLEQMSAQFVYCWKEYKAERLERLQKLVSIAKSEKERIKDVQAD